VGALPDIDAGLLERALARSRDGFLLSDVTRPGSPVVYANASFETLTGYGQADILGRNCSFLQGEGSDPAAVEEMSRTLREGGSCEVTLLNYRKDGTPFWNEVKLSPVCAEDGSLTHYVGTQHDVTARVESEAAPAGETILLVEDQDPIRRLIKRILARRGYTVLDAAHPEEALRLFEGHDGAIDLVLTDMVMPGMSGRALAERLAGREPGIGQLFMSGYPDDAVVSSGPGGQNHVFLQKPFTEQALLEGVRRAMPERVLTPTVNAA